MSFDIPSRGCIFESENKNGPSGNLGDFRTALKLYDNLATQAKLNKPHVRPWSLCLCRKGYQANQAK
jgi:hypothetical protein